MKFKMNWNNIYQYKTSTYNMTFIQLVGIVIVCLIVSVFGINLFEKTL